MHKNVHSFVILLKYYGGITNEEFKQIKTGVDDNENIRNKTKLFRISKRT